MLSAETCRRLGAPRCPWVTATLEVTRQVAPAESREPACGQNWSVEPPEEPPPRRLSAEKLAELAALAEETRGKARRVLGNLEEVGDVVNEVFLKLEGGERRGRIPVDPPGRRGVAFEVANNECMNHFRRQKTAGTPTDPAALAESKSVAVTPDYEALAAAEAPDIEGVGPRLRARWAERETLALSCPVEQHKGICPSPITDALRRAVSHVCAFFDAHEVGVVDGSFGEERRVVREWAIAERQKDRLEEISVANQKADEKWVERYQLACFDWWTYWLMRAIDGFDVEAYADDHRGGELWPVPLERVEARAGKYIRALQVHRWRALRFFDCDDAGKWRSESYSVKRLRILVQECRDLQVVISIHLPAMADALRLEDVR